MVGLSSLLSLLPNIQACAQVFWAVFATLTAFLVLRGRLIVALRERDPSSGDREIERYEYADADTNGGDGVSGYTYKYSKSKSIEGHLTDSYIDRTDGETMWRDHVHPNCIWIRSDVRGGI